MKKGQGMKKKTRNRTVRNGADLGPEAKRIHFEYVSSTAESVAIAGTFNEWRPETTPMIALARGRWARDLALPSGHYEYCLVVDGRWTSDPRAIGTVPNPFGGVNSVLRVEDGG